MPRNNLILLRKGTNSSWTSSDTILNSGEPGFDITNNQLKIGDGVSNWNNLIPINYNLNNYSITGVGNIDISGSGLFTGDLNISSQTSNTIASFDSNKNIISLNTTTYPSLTELSYVKGVTSSIQTQLNAKANSSHTHTSSQITDFNSSVSGLLPITGIVGSEYINISNINRNFTISANGLQPAGNYSVVGHSHFLSNITDAGSLASQNSNNVNISGGNINNFNVSTYSPSLDNIKISKNNINHYTYFVNIETTENIGTYNILSENDNEVLTENNIFILTEYYGSKSYLVPSGSFWQYDLKLNVVENTSNLSSFFNVKGSLKNINGVILIGAQAKNSIKEDGMENVDLNIVANGNFLEIRISPPSGSLLSCGGVLEVVEFIK